MSSFDPNGVGIANGNLFGFPMDENNADIHILPIPWDATASYGKGTSDGPQAILDASTQLDFYHHKLENAYHTKIFFHPIPEVWKTKNDMLCTQTIDYISFLEEGGELEKEPKYIELLKEVNAVQNDIRNTLRTKATELLKQHKIVGVLGGEHSTPLGLIEAVDALGENFGILQIDAHADLRDAYENFEQSHASIMFNALKNCSNLSRLVQVGIRDIAQCEVDIIKCNPSRIFTFFDWDIKANRFEGKSWAEQVEDILHVLPHTIYISFDIDGLSPDLCPNTGTPVPGGFDLEEINYLLFRLAESGRKIVAFDLNEVAPGEYGDWDANVGARALWNLICAVEKNRRSHIKS